MCREESHVAHALLRAALALVPTPAAIDYLDISRILFAKNSGASNIAP